MRSRLLGLVFTLLVVAAAPALVNARPTGIGGGPGGISGTGDSSSSSTNNPPSVSGITFGPSTANPYAGPYPSYLFGIGGIGWYDTQPLATNSIYAPNGSVTIANPFTYGDLNTAMGLTVGANSNRPGCVAGFSNPNQVATYDEFGASALCSQIDSVPLEAAVAGAFTPTSFIPSTPVALTLYVGMWIRTNDPGRFNGQITSWTSNSGKVTSIAVSGWYQYGGGSTPGTPAGTIAYINPQDKLWNQLSTTFLNVFTVAATTSNGSTDVVVAATTGLYPNGNFITGTGIADGTIITAVNYSTKHITLSKAATASGLATLSVTAGTSLNRAVAMEMDLLNNGPAFTPIWITGTADVAAGSRTLSNVTSISSWRAGLIAYGLGIPAGDIVTSVDYAGNSMTIALPASATNVGTAIKGANNFEEAGTGIDCFGTTNNSNACYLNRGSVSYGFLSMGAGDTSFLARPDAYAALPLYGFRVDGRINSFPSIASFAVTNDTTLLWGIDSGGNETVNGVTASGTITVGSHNSVVIFGQPDGTYPVIEAQGAVDSDVGILYLTKGTGAHLFRPRTDSNGAFRVQNAAGTLTNFAVNTSSGAVAIASIADPSNSALSLTGGTAQTTSVPIISATQTWVTSGTAYVGLLFDVTNTASSASSMLLRLSVGGVSQFQVTPVGAVQLAVGNFSRLPTCSGSTVGTFAAVGDSNTQTWGATISGGSGSQALAYCDGTNWTVAGK